MRADAATEQAIFAAVDAFFDHLAERRLEETLAAFVPDRDAALYGSEVGEIAVGPEALHRFFESFYARPNGPRFAVGSVVLPFEAMLRGSPVPQASRSARSSPSHIG